MKEELSYYISGVQVPLKYILNYKTLTAEDVHNEPNAEVRRHLIMLMGVSKFLHQSSAQYIQHDEYGQLLTLTLGDDEYKYIRWENDTIEDKYLNIPDDRKFEMLVTEDGRKVYFHEAPLEVETSKEATAWSFGRSKNKDVFIELLDQKGIKHNLKPMKLEDFKFDEKA